MGRWAMWVGGAALAVVVVVVALVVLLRHPSGEIEARVQTTPVGGDIWMGQVIDGAWTRTVIINPYAGAEAVEEQLGFPWDTTGTGIESHDGICHLVFADPVKVETWRTVRRQQADFCPSTGQTDLEVPRDRPFRRLDPAIEFPVVLPG